MRIKIHNHLRKRAADATEPSLAYDEWRTVRKFTGIAGDVELKVGAGVYAGQFMVTERGQPIETFSDESEAMQFIKLLERYLKAKVISGVS